MAMFDLEDSSKIDLKNVHTSSETLLKGKRLRVVEVSSATSGASSQEDALEKGKDSGQSIPKSAFREILIIVLGGVILLFVTALLVHFFPVLKPN